MLQHLTISHYALIEHLDIDWNEGFSVITGETGAGKSIMLGALNLLLGGRADAKAIQDGEKKCMVEAFFNIEKMDLQSFFDSNNIDYDPLECIVRREVMQTGKSRAFINDSPVSVSVLKEFGRILIDIHSQHQNLLIQNENFLIQTLDTMLDDKTVLELYREAYSEWQKLNKELSVLQEKSLKSKTDAEYNQFVLSQIDDADLLPDEQEKLEQEQSLLSHAEDIKCALVQSHEMVNSEELSTIHALRQATDILNSISEHYIDAGSLASRIDSVRIELEDIDAELTRDAESVEFDPARLQFVEDRLTTIYNLMQKYHKTNVEDLLSYADQIRRELNVADNIDFEIAELTKQLAESKLHRDELACHVTEARKKAAFILEHELKVSLQNLGMPNVDLNIAIQTKSHMDSTGADDIVFLFSANKNVALQDVSKIASGGEIARLMLALKAIIAKRSNLPTIVFDEIDTGVSGTMAQRMAQMMREISEHCQVLCITHLPQIAAAGNNHYRVFKEDSEERTRSHIVKLSDEERVNEIANMLSGSDLSEAAINNARELLKN